MVSKDLTTSRGKIPHDLSGIYIRNGTNQQFTPRGFHHLFGGEGMLHGM
jgi:carotenoid cleavage dioxygenase-like enzyme